MKRPREKRSPRGNRPTERAQAREWVKIQRIEALESENLELRRALRELVGWYDTFDSPEGASPDLTDKDFDRYRLLSKGSLRVVATVRWSGSP